MNMILETKRLFHRNMARYEKDGMTFVEEYADPEDKFTRVYAITRTEWEGKS